MSLDVYLRIPGATIPGGDKIYIRAGDATKEVSRAEWDERHPDQEPVTMKRSDSDVVYSANITHNMGVMAEVVGLYKPLWRPEEIDINQAKQLIIPLRIGLIKMLMNRLKLLQYNPSNGWGNYDVLFEFTRKYLAACEDNPEAEVSVSR